MSSLDRLTDYLQSVPTHDRAAARLAVKGLLERLRGIPLPRDNSSLPVPPLVIVRANEKIDLSTILDRCDDVSERTWVGLIDVILAERA